MKTLHHTLQHQLSTHEAINTKLRELRVAVVMGKTDEVANINEQLLSLGNQLKALEVTRKESVEKLGYASKPLNEIIPHLPIAEQTNLKKLREKLNATIDLVQQEKDDTKAVLEHSMDWVKQAMGTIASHVAKAQPKTQHYGSAGKTGATVPVAAASARRSIIERKA